MIPGYANADSGSVDAQSGSAKLSFRLPKVRLPFGSTAAGFALAAVVILGELGVIAACIISPAMVPAMVYTTIGAGVLGSTIGILAAITND